MKNIKNLSEQEKLDLFQIEELESRLELGSWGGGGDANCNTSCNGSCGNGSCGGGGDAACGTNSTCGGGGGGLNVACGNEVPIQL